jgi:cellulose 1,4-beta-cellobiosidase
MLLYVLSLMFGVAVCQQKGSQTQEYHPKMTIQHCTKSGGCQDESPGQITIDSNWRWTHKTGGTTNCYTGNEWDKTICDNVADCTKACALEGVDQQTWQGTYGVHEINGGIQLDFVTQGPYSRNVGSRTYYMESESKYKMWKLVNKEFTFDTDVSQLDCGLNGALYFSELQPDGGMSEYETNECGAKYGTGYCDAQCPHDMKWIYGESNSDGWVPSDTDPNSGVGKYGICCNEMDIWESNKHDSAFTPHVCKTAGPYRCTGTECGDNGPDRYKGHCDKDGCDLNAYRAGNKTFFGAGSNFNVDSSQPITVVTQFISSDGTDNGDLVEIKRLFVQNGNVIDHAFTNLPGLTPFNSLTDANCAAFKKLTGDVNDFKAKGGMKGMGEALKRGMVLVMSLWDDHYAHMLWLDSSYPLDKPTTDPGITRGPCDVKSGDPKDVESKQAHAHVKYYNVKWGDIGSTYGH